MKVTDIIIYVMKIMSRDFKKSRSSRFRDTVYKNALKVQIFNEVALIQVVRKRVILVLKIAKTKIHQNFLASKYDIKKHSDAV